MFVYGGVGSSLAIVAQLKQRNSVLSCLPCISQIFHGFSKVLECTRDIKLRAGKENKLSWLGGGIWN